MRCPAALWQRAVRIVIVVQCEADLLQIISARNATSRFPGRLHSGKKETDENRDDGDHDQQFDQREAASA